MSLKSFHLIFITIATLLCLGIAVWAFGFSRGQTSELALGALSALGTIGLPLYGYRFYQKAKKILS